MEVVFVESERSATWPQALTVKATTIANELLEIGTMVASPRQGLDLHSLNRYSEQT
jgi:hypothetical protein